MFRKHATNGRIAIIEYNRHHGQIVPAMVKFLDGVGLKVDVYCDPRFLRLDPFVLTRKPKCALYSCRSVRYRLWTEKRLHEYYDCIIANSIEPIDRLRRFAGYAVPMIAVVHNGDLVQHVPEYREFFSPPHHQPLLLAEHIAQHFALPASNHWIFPFVSDTVHTKEVRRRRKVRFGIQGSVELNRRNYSSLLEAVGALQRRHINNVEFYIVGKNNSRDGDSFREQIRRFGLASYFVFTKREAGYKEFYSLLESCDCILPLIDRTSSSFDAYFSSKLVSAMCIAIGLGILPVAHAELAQVFGVTDCSICYVDDALASALERMMCLSDEEVRNMRKRLIEEREHLLTRSSQNFQELVMKVIQMGPIA